MTDIINLNQQRKAKAHLDKQKKAAENRVKFGRTKEEKQAQKQKSEQVKKLLDAHKREKGEE